MCSSTRLPPRRKSLCGSTGLHLRRRQRQFMPAQPPPNGVLPDLDIPFSIPPFAYCTDNAAMIGAAAFYRWREQPGLGRDLQVDVHATLPLPGTE